MPNPVIPAVTGEGLAPPQGSAATPAVQVQQRDNSIPAHPMVAAAQAPAPVAPAAPSPNQSPNDWDAFVSEVMDVDTEAHLPPETPAARIPAAPAAAPVASEFPSIDQILAGQIAPEPQAAQPPAAQPQPAAPAQPPAQAPVAMPSLEQVQQNAIDYLMANDYKLSDSDRTQLISEPDVVLPRMAARMHVGITTGVMQQMQQIIPMIVQQQVSGLIAAQRAEMEFFSEYPALNRPEYRPIVAESLAFVQDQARMRGVTLPRDQLKRNGAAWAAFQIRQQGVRVAPAAPAAPAAVPRSPMAPFVPVATGGGGAPSAPTQPTDIWGQLAMDPDLLNF